MKTFFKMLLATVTGIITMTILLLIIVVASLTQSPEPVRANSILKISLTKPLEDRAGVPSINLTGRKIETHTGLNKILFAIERAKSDDKIKGIFLNLSQVSAGMASVEEIRDALEDFKQSSGKYILAYAESYSQKAYFLATVADRIYLNPFGNVAFKGLSGEVTMFKGLLDKLGIDVQVIRHGKFKSAIEPFTLDKISPENREQISTYLGSIWDYMVHTVSVSRDIEVDELNKIADNMELMFADDALNRKFVNKLLYEDEVMAELQKYSGSTLNIVDISKYTLPDQDSDKANKIAVIYAAGDIMAGDGDSDIMSKNMMRTISAARRDSSIKAVVLRVDSPGGSADAAEFIARELELTAKCKPVVVSMGNLAASGGYWIATPGQTIFAHRTTLTGSIGVFGMIPNFGKAAKDKLGIGFDVVSTNAHSDFPSVTRPLQASEIEYLQKSVEFIYSKFIEKVAASRKITVAKVDELGQGRVWSGVNAMELGLIDAFGGLKEAILEAASLAGVSDYGIVELPKEMGTFEMIARSLEVKISGVPSGVEFDGMVKQYETLVKRLKNYGILAKLPFEINS